MTFSIANLSLGIIFIFNIFEYYRAFSCSAAELCVISNVVQCNSGPGMPCIPWLPVGPCVPPGPITMAANWSQILNINSATSRFTNYMATFKIGVTNIFNRAAHAFTMFGLADIFGPHNFPHCRWNFLLPTFTRFRFGYWFFHFF